MSLRDFVFSKRQISGVYGSDKMEEIVTVGEPGGGIASAFKEQKSIFRPNALFYRYYLS